MARVSVVTPTWQQPELVVYGVLPSLASQTFDDFQHVVVSDGPDPLLRAAMTKLGYGGQGDRVFVELGRNWHGFMGGDGDNNQTRGSRAAHAAQIGTHLASSEYIAYLDDDCTYKPRHLESLLGYLDDGADLAFGCMERFWGDEPWDVVGDGTVEFGHIDGNMIVHRADLLRVANWEWEGWKRPYSDWNIIEKWKLNDMRIIFHPEITVSWYGHS